MNEPIAVVVPVLNEADNLAALLDDLAGQEHAAEEVIVVDAGSTDGTQALVEDRRESWPSLRLCRLPGARPGGGRNEGIRSSHCRLIATLDAGTRVDSDWLATLSEPLRAAPDAWVVCFGIAVPDARSEFERASGWFTLRAFKPPTRKPLLSPRHRPPGRNGFCFRRAAWEAAGGYPEDLRWGEDKIFIDRIEAAGAELMVVPDAVTRWRPRRSLREVFIQYDDYGRGDALAGIDRQNELITIGIYGLGVLLFGLTLAGSELAALALVAGVLVYFGAFVFAAVPHTGPKAGLGWIPLIRLTADLAKMRGFVTGHASRVRGRAAAA